MAGLQSQSVSGWRDGDGQTGHVQVSLPSMMMAPILTQKSPKIFCAEPEKNTLSPWKSPAAPRRKARKKYSLLKRFLVKLSKLNTLAARISTELRKKILIHYQMDGAGPYQDKVLLAKLEKEFDRRR